MPTAGRCPSHGVKYSGISPALQVLLPVSQSVSKEEAERQLLDEYFLLIVYQLTASYGKIHSCNAFTLGILHDQQNLGFGNRSFSLE